jgi:hypothetical protein
MRKKDENIWDVMKGCMLGSTPKMKHDNAERILISKIL